MIKGKKNAYFENIETVIARQVAVKGEISSEGSMRIDGEVEGKLSLKGDLVIGENSRIHGDIKGINILVAGLVKGNIIASGRVEITPTGKVIGDVEANTLVVEEGAKFHGHSKMTIEDKAKTKVGDKNEPAKGKR